MARQVPRDGIKVVTAVMVVLLAIIFQEDVGKLLHPIGAAIVLPDSVLRLTSNLLSQMNEQLTCLFWNMPKMKPTKSSYDFIIVGAGSSGSVVAARLAEDPSLSVLVIESGPTDKHLFVDMPLASPFLQGTERDWGLQVERTEHACQGMVCTKDPKYAGQTGCCRWPMGRGLGGGSTINYMAYVRGNPEDFNEWERMGAQGWNYSAVLPYFKKSENNGVFRFSSFHGTVGPLDVNDPHERNPITAAFVEGCAEIGLEDNPDYNGLRQEGCSRLQATTRNAERWSASRAFLWPALASRPNLEVVSLADVLKVELDCAGEDGCAASGVVLRDRTGAEIAVHASREVVLAASAVMTPKLLMLSGVGPKEHLEAHGIEPKVNLPGVGQNLQDHTFLIMIFNSSKDFDNFGYDAATQRLYRMDDGGHGFVLLPTLLHQGVTGSVRLRSADPLAPPLITPSYLEHADDMATFLAGVKLAIELANSPSMREFTDGTLRINWDRCPHSRCGCPERELALTSDSWWECMVRAWASTVYHPAGTARMGGDGDEMAVLDPELRVRGVRGLRVADASSWPSVTSGNTNAPAIMVAERAADLIKASLSS